MRSRNFIRLRPYRTVFASELSRKSLWKTGDVVLKYLKANLYKSERERDGTQTCKSEERKPDTNKNVRAQVLTQLSTALSPVINFIHTWERQPIQQSADNRHFTLLKIIS